VHTHNVSTCGQIRTDTVVILNHVPPAVGLHKLKLPLKNSNLDLHVQSVMSCRWTKGHYRPLDTLSDTLYVSVPSQGKASLDHRQFLHFRSLLTTNSRLRWDLNPHLPS
jgi:hypothetical protein